VKLLQSLCQTKEVNDPQPTWPELLRQAIRLHQDGIAGDQQAVREALAILEQLRIAHPDHTRINAYYGSALCLTGRDIEDPVERSANTIKGLKLLDQALATEPDNCEIRIIRGNICVNLPEMYFHRNATAVEDFNYLISGCESCPDTIPAELYLQFLYNLSSAYANLGQTTASAAVRQKLLDKAMDPHYQQLLAVKDPAGSNCGANHFAILFQPLPIILIESAKLHQRALTGQKGDLQTALDFFAKAQVLFPDNPLFQAYHADCLSLRASAASNTGEMFANAIKATKTIDAAVVSNPDNITLRLIRAQHSLRLPELFFARSATAITDLEYLARRAEQQPELFSKAEAEAILFKLGISYRRLGLNSEAEEVWRKLGSSADPEIQSQIALARQNESPPPVNSTLSLQTDREAFYTEARHLHELGVNGNKTAAQLGLKLWEEAHNSDPADPVAQGYYGSSLALVGKYTAGINDMFGGAIKGLKIINEALTRDPDNWELRLLRAYLGYSLPEAFFHTTRQAIQDLQFLKKAYEQNDTLFPPKLYEQIRRDLKSACQRMGQSEM
jgi:hypothetical protein